MQGEKQINQERLITRCKARWHRPNIGALMVRIGLWGPLYYNYLRPYTNCWRSGGRNRCSYICCICWHMYCILLADNLIYEILLLVVVVVVVVGGGAIAFTVDI